MINQQKPFIHILILSDDPGAWVYNIVRRDPAAHHIRVHIRIIHLAIALGIVAILTMVALCNGLARELLAQGQLATTVIGVGILVGLYTLAGVIVISQVRKVSDEAAVRLILFGMAAIIASIFGLLNFSSNGAAGFQLYNRIPGAQLVITLLGAVLGAVLSVSLDRLLRLIAK